MNDERMRAAYQEWLRKPRPSDRATCPSPDALLALAEQRGIEGDRLVTLDHAMACDACRRDLDLLRTVAATGGLESRVIRPWMKIAAVLALVAVSGLWILAQRPPDDTLRGVETVTAMAPIGQTSGVAAHRFVWRGVDDATSYRVELLSATGDSVYTATTVDTVLALPASIAFAVASEYLWTVRALRPDGSYVVSEPLRFRITE